MHFIQLKISSVYVSHHREIHRAYGHRTCSISTLRLTTWHWLRHCIPVPFGRPTGHTDRLKPHGEICWYLDDVIKWKQFPRYWPFARGINRSPVRCLVAGGASIGVTWNFLMKSALITFQCANIPVKKTQLPIVNKKYSFIGILATTTLKCTDLVYIYIYI